MGGRSRGISFFRKEEYMEEGVEGGGWVMVVGGDFIAKQYTSQQSGMHMMERVAQAREGARGCS